jgi:hypothetical protein
LISNAADALEKFRHASITETDIFDDHLPLEITIELDEKKNTLTITDTGIGMTRSELEHNLGTIAHSGSNSYLAELVEAAKKEVNSESASILLLWLVGRSGYRPDPGIKVRAMSGCRTVPVRLP